MWTITDGPDPGPDESRDTRGWRWEIERDGVTRRMLVEVTGQAEMEPVNSDVQQVVVSEGRVAVESILDRDDPPGRITYTREGRQEEPYRGGD